MKRVLHTSFLLVLIVLLGGYSRAYAHTKASLSIHTSSESHLLHNEHVFVRPGASPAERQNQDLVISLFENEEDEDLGSYKKQLESGNLPTAVLFSHLAWPFFTRPEKIKPFCHTISDSSSWYIVLQVFRI